MLGNSISPSTPFCFKNVNGGLWKIGQRLSRIPISADTKRIRLLRLKQIRDLKHGFGDFSIGFAQLQPGAAFVR